MQRDQQLCRYDRQFSVDRDHDLASGFSNLSFLNDRVTAKVVEPVFQIVRLQLIDAVDRQLAPLPIPAACSRLSFVSQMLPIFIW
jgi:hypothetical protein